MDSNSTFDADPIVNAIQNGIKEDIELTFSHNRFRATIILIYSGMDTMAFLDMPAGQDNVKRTDFVCWSGRYMRFPCKDQITGEDFYGARCAMLHSYGVVSNMSREGKCRMIGYADQCVGEVRYAPQISKDLVLVSIRALKDAFFKGIDRFLVDAFADPARIPTLERRLQHLIQISAMPG